MSNATFVHTVLSQSFMPIRDGLDQSELATQLADIVRQLLSRDVKTVSVVGGAASGKTTIAEELVDNLRRGGTTSDILSTDDYAAGDRYHRQVKLKNADAKERYDFKLMNKHIAAIRALENDSDTVAVPVMDDETGIAASADPKDFKHEVGKVDVLVIEGDFPRDDYDVRFYVHVPDEQRLENNIERAEEKDDETEIGKLTEAFKDRQRILHAPYTLPALESADYVLEADTTEDEWYYTLYQKTGDTKSS